MIKHLSMKSRLLATLTLCSVFSLATPLKAENLAQTQQLLSTRECQGCDLREAGLVLADLSEVNLSRANLSGANLNRVNFDNANLNGANLAGAILFGANLTGADLRGADLRSADLRDAVLTGARLDGALLDGANLLGTIGLQNDIATPEQMYMWGMQEMQRGNFRGAIAYYDQALVLQPDFAHAVFARAIARLRMRDVEGAIQDGKRAEAMYLAQLDEQSHQAAGQFVTGLEETQQAIAEREDRARRGGGSNFMGFLGGLANLALQALPLFLGF